MGLLYKQLKHLQYGFTQSAQIFSMSKHFKWLTGYPLGAVWLVQCQRKRKWEWITLRPQKCKQIRSIV